MSKNLQALAITLAAMTFVIGAMSLWAVLAHSYSGIGVAAAIGVVFVGPLGLCLFLTLRERK